MHSRSIIHNIILHTGTTVPILRLSRWFSGKESPQFMQETWVQSLGWEDSLEKGITTHSSILAWRIPGTDEPGGLQSMGL